MERGIIVVCPCQFPILFTDNRHGQRNSYIAFPNDTFEEMEEIPNPSFEEVTEDGEEYMAVMYISPIGKTTKRYLVNDHICLMGCDAKIDSNGKSIACKRKDMFIVMHPIDEWNSEHIVEISNNRRKQHK
jgi:hypothetical protein